MRKYLHSLALASVIAISAFANSVTFAKTLNEQETEFFQTQTGQHLKTMIPACKTPEELVKSALNKTVDAYTIDGFDYSNKQAEIEKIYNSIVPFIQQEIDTRHTHYAFYHGHSNEISLYVDLLHEFTELCGLKELPSSHPLRLKNSKDVKNVKEFLSKFTEQYVAEARNRKVKPYDATRNSGFTFAPDLIPYARENTISVNTSLFGNMDSLGEYTFYYFLNSFNIGHPNEKLIQNLLVETGLAASDPTAFAQQVDLYKGLFTEKMKQAGGGLMQILIKKDAVDSVGYASWAKGIPFYVDQKTGAFATRNHNKKAIPLLKDRTDHYKRPSLSSMLGLYKRNPNAFIKKYSSGQRKTRYSFDRFQARLVVNPEIFTDPSKVIVNRTFRSPVDGESSSQYKQTLKQQMVSDLVEAIHQNKLSRKFGYPIEKLVAYVHGKLHLNLKEIASIVKNTSQSLYKKAIDAIDLALHKAGNFTNQILNKFNVLKTFEMVRDDIVKFGSAFKERVGAFYSYVRKLMTR